MYEGIRENRDTFRGYSFLRDGEAPSNPNKQEMFFFCLDDGDDENNNIPKQPSSVSLLSEGTTHNPQ